jgi:hypothetical protein
MIRILAALGIVAASSVVSVSQSVEGSDLEEHLFSAYYRAEGAYINWDLPTAKKEIDEALSLLMGQRVTENAVLEHKLQRLGGDVARHSGGDAEKYYRRALKALDRAEGAWIQHRIDTETAFGTLLIEKGRPDAAIAIAVKTIEDIKAVLGDDANTQYFISSYRTISIANMVKRQYNKALSAQSQAIDSFGKPRGAAANLDFAASDKLWFETVQLAKADFKPALHGFADMLDQGSFEQCHAAAGILTIARDARAGEAALEAGEMLQSNVSDAELEEHLADCLTKGTQWATRKRFWHHRLWWHFMKKLMKKEWRKSG